eukprot:XP_011412798.2 PREDICTED: tyrosine kinase receptor Cad96Ca [Crassostrea gigas]
MDLIATGSYCEVWRGRMRKHSDSTDVLRVAIKKMLDDASAVGRKYFLAEMEVMKSLKAHSNVITLIGCYTLTEPWMLMLEYAHEGTLQRYLQKHRPGAQHVEIQSQESVRLKNSKIDAKKLLSMATQVINGLLHLTKYKLIYYRLSASSILVAKGGVCKLSGFGFQKEITERNIYEKESLPVRCMAPESLSQNIYDTRSDTYAFGILLWQIIHFEEKSQRGTNTNTLTIYGASKTLQIEELSLYTLKTARCSYFVTRIDDTGTYIVPDECLACIEKPFYKNKGDSTISKNKRSIACTL